MPTLSEQPLKYPKILLKLSGEGFGGVGSNVIDFEAICHMATEIEDALSTGASIAVVVGGGNIVRGAEIAALGINRVKADQMGMLATVINAKALEGVLEGMEIECRVMTAFEIKSLAEPFYYGRAVRHWEKKRVIIFAGGTGDPYLTTDSAATLRALEMGADVVIMAKNGVDGVYDADPRKFPDAKMHEFITFLQVLNDGLAVMDSTALSQCMTNKVPIMVMNLMIPGNLKKAILGKQIGTLITN